LGAFVRLAVGFLSLAEIVGYFEPQWLVLAEMSLFLVVESVAALDEIE
jgi:hypothetical protein